jgi:hypothetical protein
MGRGIRDLREQLATLYEDVLAGRVDEGTGAVLAQVANARTRVIETERKIKEQDELLERIEALEGQRGARRWG